MYNRLKCKRVQRVHVQKYVAPTQEVCFHSKPVLLVRYLLLRYPGRITNGRMLTGRMSVTEVIPELIPEEPPVSY